MLVDFSKFTDSERDEFVESLKSADDIGVDDWDSATPWGAPWEWASPENLDGDTPEEWGEARYEPMLRTVIPSGSTGQLIPTL